ncbi:MAG: excinuclease ABC subunit UvrC [Geobacteraceae bacterium]|nr:excinuclease ABC subunit UvrC [Geobacteraceae bacterium]
MKPESTDTLPQTPGVYIMRNASGAVLYVGKAKNLRSRVRSYFTKARDSRYHIRFLMARVADIDYIVTDTEKEALILENTLIKQHRPRYNINLRDDKTYFSLRMDPAEEFPRLSIIRKVRRDGARYFGPYSSAAAAREVLKQLYRIFPLRHYPIETCRRRGRPCLYHQLRQCSAPCHGMISRQDYAALAEGAALFLEGKNRYLLKIFRKKMADAAGAQNYEEAARFRDLAHAVEITVEKQKMVTQGGDMDALGIFRHAGHIEAALLFIRGGSLIGSRNYSFSWEMEDEEGISSFLSEYYGKDVYIPEEVLLSARIPGMDSLGEFLSERKGKRVAVTFPRRGTKADLVRLACRNAETAAEEKQRSRETAEMTLAELRDRLHLPSVPGRIECYDISNIQGRQAVGSRVVFQDGKPDRKSYRRYRIRTVDQADDYGMMQEVLSRRFSGSGSTDPVPDLVIVDGGPGQLNILRQVLSDLKVGGIAIAALAKSRVESGAEEDDLKRSDERVFLPGRKNPVVLRQNSAPLLLLARVRDEAHRFAVSYHTDIRSREALQPSARIPGVGEKRWKVLLRHFGSLKALRAATLEELTAVPGISGNLASAILDHFRRK